MNPSMNPNVLQHKSIKSTLQKNTMQAWKTALETSVDNIEIPINTQDMSELNKLATFALIVVAKGKTFAELRPVMQDWLTIQAKTPAGWVAVSVDETDDHSEVVQLISQSVSDEALQADRLTDITVLRYVLIPTANEHLQAISEAKRTAIAHVLDEQVTEHLHQALGMKDTDFDCHILPTANLLQEHKIACFDMDSTLIEQEVIVELAKATGIGGQVNDITESAMRGEIDFSESFGKRLRLLHGTQADVLDDISDSLTLSAGANTTLGILNALGYHTVLVSGGFTYFATVIAGKLSIDEYHANELMVEDGKVIGEAIPPIVDGERKAKLVEHIAKQQGVEMSEVICIGDGANDLAMMAKANLGFAYRAKPIVQAKADLAINCTGLEGVLYGLGYGAIL